MISAELTADSAVIGRPATHDRESRGQSAVSGGSEQETAGQSRSNCPRSVPVSILPRSPAGADRLTVSLRDGQRPDPGQSEAKTHPEPEVPARLAEPHEVPRGAAIVQRLAEAAGWIVVPTYARGTVAIGVRTPRVIDSLALRMRRDRRAVVAVWEDGQFALAYVWGAAPPKKVSNAELRAHIATEGTSVQ